MKYTFALAASLFFLSAKAPAQVLVPSETVTVQRIVIQDSWPFPSERVSVTLRLNTRFGTTSSLDNGNQYAWMPVPGTDGSGGLYEIYSNRLQGFPFTPEKTRIVILLNKQNGKSWWLDTGNQTHYSWRQLGSPGIAGPWEVQDIDLSTWPFTSDKKRMTLLFNTRTGLSFSLDNTNDGYAWSPMAG